MATATDTPSTTDDDLSPGAAAAVERAQLLYPTDPETARAVLAPYADEGKVRDLLRNMDRLAAPPADTGEGEGSSNGADDDSRVEDALLKTQASIDELRKSDRPGASAAVETLQGAHRTLQVGHLAKHSGGYDTSVNALREAGRLP